MLSLLLLSSALGAGCDSGKPDTHAANGQVDAAKVYRLYCTGCHGDTGQRGKGEMVLANGQRPEVAEIRAVVENGRKEMPGWKKRLSPAEIAAVVEFVRTLEANAQTH
jgi:mono/diheme cytochrome c family protein